MGSIITTPALELISNPNFDVDAVWTKLAHTTIHDGVLDVNVRGGQGGGAFQTIATRRSEVYRFITVMTQKGGDPAEGAFVWFGTGGARISSPGMVIPGTYEWIVADPDGTGLVAIESFFGFDDNSFEITSCSCKLFADIVLEDLGFADLENTFTNTYLLAGSKVMVQVVNVANSINQTMIVSY